MNFQQLNNAIQEQFKKLSSQTHLFRVKISGKDLWQIYMDNFKEHPIWRVNSVHNCDNDRHFFERYANVVAIIDNKVVSMFDFQAEGEYKESIKAVSEAVRSSPIDSYFIESYEELKKLGSEIERSKMKPSASEYRLGNEKTLKEYRTTEEAMGKELGKVYTYYHFNVMLPKTFVEFSNKSSASILGELNTTRQLFEKGLIIPLETLELVRDLIQQGSLLRGDMYLNKVLEFIKLKQQYEKLPAELRQNWLWLNFKSIPFARFANELIGTTCIELAEGKDINEVCKSFNQRVDPANYNKAKAPITKAQIALAEKTIIDLGYNESFERRFAQINDIDVSEIKHTNVDNTANKPVGLFGAAGVPSSIMSNRHKRAEFDNIETVNIDKFMADILPNITSMEVFMENRMEGNLVSLFTAQNKLAKNLFKWDNSFSWTYNGNLSGKSQLAQMVAAKGGRLDGVLRFTHSWNRLEPNQSLMDAHVFLPGNNHTTGTGDYYGKGRRVGWNLRTDNLSGGNQDVDYIDQAPIGYIPVENITFPDLSKLTEGTYTYKIHNWSFRKSGGRGEAEIGFEGNVYQYEYPATKHKEWIDVAEVTLKNGRFTIIHKLPLKNESSKTLWNLETNQFHKVNLVCTSPNHWGANNIGTKEYFFMMQDCKTDQPMRAFHVDQLNSELMGVRKAIDLLGNYKMVEPADKQLSGVGFNSTTRDEIVVKVKGTHQRTLKIKF